MNVILYYRLDGNVNAIDDINIELRENLIVLQSYVRAQVRIELGKDNFWMRTEMASTFP